MIGAVALVAFLVWIGPEDLQGTCARAQRRDIGDQKMTRPLMNCAEGEKQTLTFTIQRVVLDDDTAFVFCDEGDLKPAVKREAKLIGVRKSRQVDIHSKVYEITQAGIHPPCRAIRGIQVRVKQVQ